MKGMATGSIFKVSPAVARSRKRTRSAPVLIRAVYKSKLEDQLAQQLEERGVPFEYEPVKLKYTVPAKVHTYTPDFALGPKTAKRRIIIESKGYFTPADRKVIAYVKEQHPDLDLRMVFSRASTKIHKNSPTTYGMWCEKHDIPYADKGTIPEEWIEEARSLA